MIIYTIGDLDDHGETIHTASVENHVFFLPDHMVKHKGYLLGFKFKADVSGTPKFQVSKKNVYCMQFCSCCSWNGTYMYKYSKIRFSKLCVHSLIVTCLIYERTKGKWGWCYDG